MSGNADPPNSPKPTFRLAHENNLFTSSVEKWLQYAEAPIDTTPDYEGEKAVACLELIPEFIDHAIGLYQTMTAKTWE